MAIPYVLWPCHKFVHTLDFTEIQTEQKFNISTTTCIIELVGKSIDVVLQLHVIFFTEAIGCGCSPS